MSIGYQTCGSSYNVCYGSSPSTGSSTVGAIVACIFLVICCGGGAFGWYRHRRRAMRLRQPVGGYAFTPPIQQPQYSYQQQPMQTAPRVTYANPNTYPHVAAPIPNNYEKPPPSYEAASRDTRFTYPIPSAPPAY